MVKYILSIIYLSSSVEMTNLIFLRKFFREDDSVIKRGLKCSIPG